MTVWNEAMYYFAMAEDYKKILFVLRDYSDKKERPSPSTTFARMTTLFQMKLRSGNTRRMLEK